MKEVGYEAEPIITQQHCLRCGYKWFPHRWKLPKVCPKCNSPYWYKPVKRVSVSKAVKKHAAKLIFSDVTSTHKNPL